MKAISRVIWVRDDESAHAVAREWFGPEYHVEHIGLVRVRGRKLAKPRIVDGHRVSPFRVRVRPLGPIR